jgi:hypothetical protein
MLKLLSGAALLLIMAGQASAICPAPSEVAKSLKVMPHLNPGMSMKPDIALGEYIVGAVNRGSHVRTGVDAPTKLSVIDRGNVCDYREGTIMKGITMEFDLVRLPHFYRYWNFNHQHQAVFYGNHKVATDILNESLRKSEEEAHKHNPPL